MTDFLSEVENTVTGATSKVAGFIMHYGNELTSVAGVLSQLVSALPIDAQDKANIVDTIDGLNNAAKNAIAGANEVTTGGSAGDVVVQRSDVDAAVADYFASDAGKAAIAAALKPAETPATPSSEPVNVVQPGN